MMAPLVALAPNGCLFAVSSGETPADHLFCDEPREGARSYCPAHCRVAYRPARLAQDAAEKLARIVTRLEARAARPSFRADLVAAMEGAVAG